MSRTFAACTAAVLARSYLLSRACQLIPTLMGAEAGSLCPTGTGMRKRPSLPASNLVPGGMFASNSGRGTP